MRHSAIAVALCLACAPATAAAQSMDQAQSQLSGILREIEGNLVDRDAIEMNFKVWKANEDAFKPRLDDLNRRIEESNAYCQGTFEHDEYVRRKAQCDSTQSQLDTLKAQLDPEFENLKAEFEKLQQREADRAAAFQAIHQRLAAALAQLVLACAPLSAAEFAASCHLPPAPGPRSADLIAQINANIAGHPK